MPVNNDLSVREPSVVDPVTNPADVLYFKTRGLGSLINYVSASPKQHFKR